MAEAWKKEYDQRQYHLMADQLKRFEKGELGFVFLISGLKSLLSVLQATDEMWKDEFRSEWGTLEVAYAMLLDQKGEGHVLNERAALDDLANRPDIGQAIRNMQRLVRERIDTTASAETDSGNGATTG
jgi:hypothetical protein